MQTHNTQKNWDERLNSFYECCRQTGVKITPQRMAVYKSLIKGKSHPTSEEIFHAVRKEMPNISLDTVNRTLLMLVEIGMVFVVEGSGQPRRFDGRMKEHQHFRCLKCNKITDFHYKPYDNIKIPAQLYRIRIIRKTVYLEGYCKDCDRGS
jgi:Fur family transcriptional regulator, peroxide stress response regulator